MPQNFLRKIPTAFIARLSSGYSISMLPQPDFILIAESSCGGWGFALFFKKIFVLGRELSSKKETFIFPPRASLAASMASVFAASASDLWTFCGSIISISQEPFSIICVSPKRLAQGVLADSARVHIAASARHATMQFAAKIFFCKWRL